MSSFQPYDPNASTEGSDFDPPADGKHKGCTLTDAKALTSSNGNDGVLLELRNTDGHQWVVWQGFKSEKQSAMTWSQMGKLGVDGMACHTLEDLDAALKPHIGSYYDITVKTNGEYRNTTIDGLSLGENPNAHTAAVGASNGGGTAAPEQDDVPFAPSLL